MWWHRDLTVEVCLGYESALPRGCAGSVVLLQELFVTVVLHDLLSNGLILLQLDHHSQRHFLGFYFQDCLIPWFVCTASVCESLCSKAIEAFGESLPSSLVLEWDSSCSWKI